MLMLQPQSELSQFGKVDLTVKLWILILNCASASVKTKKVATVTMKFIVHEVLDSLSSV